MKLPLSGIRRRRYVRRQLMSGAAILKRAGLNDVAGVIKHGTSML
jgi:hypothetical protein